MHRNDIVKNIKPSIIIADDHPIARIGFRLSIERAECGRVLGEVESGDELLRCLEQMNPDVIVTDLSMRQSKTDGLELVATLIRRHPRIKVIVVTMAAMPQMVEALIRLGVSGLVSKNDDMSELARAIRRSELAMPYIGRYFRKQAKVHALSALGARLSDTEVEVLRLMSLGLSVVDVAKRRCRSSATISRQKTNAARKLGISDHQKLHEYLASIHGGAIA